ncbi:DUF2461 domain-containing protein [Krasilnikovia sp. M28-CT-15]|uniref:DUF2461 domain-containing protein n=1 Tax=Krasilnikovia sp. M28-CT-15 TaxID=3373540 RepID=UPI00399C93BB
MAETSLVAFRGWPSEALEFYEGLTADNSKTYWTAHLSVYETQVREPMAQLLADLEPEFGPGKIFRPYRDVRFSKDKSPYKTHLGAWLEAGGYIQLSADGLAAGSGMYQMAPDQLDRYRRAVADERTGQELTAVIEAIERARIQVQGHGSLKTVPRGYPKDHPRLALLRHKGLVTWKEWTPAAWLGTAAAGRRIVDFLRTSRPLRQWLDDTVGPSTAQR